jgi:hypothetical protein
MRLATCGQGAEGIWSHVGLLGEAGGTPTNGLSCLLEPGR